MIESLLNDVRRIREQSPRASAGTVFLRMLPKHQDYWRSRKVPDAFLVTNLGITRQRLRAAEVCSRLKPSSR